jgi:hypothetical protein
MHNACHGPDGVFDHKLEFSNDCKMFALGLCISAIQDLQDSKHLISATANLVFGLLLMLCSALQSVMRQHRILGWFLGLSYTIGLSNRDLSIGRGARRGSGEYDDGKR